MGFRYEIPPIYAARSANSHPDRRVTKQGLHDPKRRPARRQDRRERVPQLVPFDSAKARPSLRRRQDLSELPG